VLECGVRHVCCVDYLKMKISPRLRRRIPQVEEKGKTPRRR
jgi:hypothetical protein